MIKKYRTNSLQILHLKNDGTVIDDDSVGKTQGIYETIVDRSNERIMKLHHRLDIRNEILKTVPLFERPKSAISSIDLQEAMLPTSIKKCVIYII